MSDSFPEHRPLTIVAADDDPSIRQLLAAILTRCGYKVHLAENGSQAIALVHDVVPDLVILDYNMPDLDGERVAAVLRATSKTGAIPLLLLSASDDAVAKDNPAARLWDGRVQKPFTPDVLKSEIQRLVSSEERAVAHVGEAETPVWGGVARSMRQDYLGVLVDAVEEMESSLESAAEGDSCTAVLGGMRRRFHQIRGSAASYGFPGIGDIAADAERLIEQWLRTADAEPDLTRLRDAVSDIGMLLTATRDATSAEEAGAESEGAEPANNRILALDDDPRLLAEVSRIGRRLDWEIEAFQSPEAALERVREREFVIVALGGEAAREDDCHWVGRFRAEAGSAALVLHAGDGSTVHRLRAVEAGIHLYLAGDITAAGLAAEWRGVLEQAQTAAGKVLIVDDDRSILEFESAELTRSGCQVVCVDDADDVFAQLEKNDPDLLLMDVDMPSANGLEVARAIRSSRRWGSIPVIIQTVHSSPEFRLQAFESGADDFLNKPILEEELRARVLGRLERERAKKDSAEKDPVTSFLSRAAFVEKAAALARKCADGALATIEVERLTSFRHRHGLEAGDVAIAALADSLRDAFRNGKTVLGRVTEGVLAVMQGDVSEEELAVRLELCLADLEFDHRLVPDVASSPGLVLEASAIALGADHDVAARLDDALRARSREGRVRVTRASKAHRLQPSSVFLVESERCLREMLEYSLTNAGYEVHSFAEGTEALAALKQFPVRGRRPLVLLDIDLPGLDGFSILDELEREKPGLYKVVLLTPQGNERDQIRGLRSQAVDSISKPVRVELLLTKLERYADRDGSA